MTLTGIHIHRCFARLAPLSRAGSQLGRMRWGCPTVSLTLLCVSWLLLLAGAAVAQPPELEDDVAPFPGHHPHLFVVVESAHGDVFADRVRKLIAEHVDAKVGPSGQSAAQEPVDVLLSVRVPSNGKKDVQVIYWDRTGMTESIVAPQPYGVGSLGWVVASLAVGLVRRHAELLADPLLLTPRCALGGLPAPTGGCAFPGAWAPGRVQGLLRHFGLVTHRTEGLTEADF